MTDAFGALERSFRQGSGRAVAALIRVTGDFDLAEEAVQDAVAGALEVWPDQGVPRNPGAWIVTGAFPTGSRARPIVIGSGASDGSYSPALW